MWDHPAANGRRAEWVLGEQRKPRSRPQARQAGRLVDGGRNGLATGYYGAPVMRVLRFALEYMHPIRQMLMVSWRRLLLHRMPALEPPLLQVGMVGHDKPETNNRPLRRDTLRDTL
jgi:hypothetical protein